MSRIRSHAVGYGSSIGTWLRRRARRDHESNLEGLFLELDEMARTDGKLVELAVYGGAALILVFPARSATRDVDADGDVSPWRP